MCKGNKAEYCRNYSKLITFVFSLGKPPIIRPHSQEKVTKSDSAEVCVKKAISEKVLSLPKLQHDDITEKVLAIIDC